MSESVKMPALGESVTEGTVSRWLKQVGDFVEADEALLEVSTDKVDSEVPSPISGVVTEILVPEDDTVDVGTVLCIIGESSELPTSSTPVSSDSESITSTVQETTVPAPEVVLEEVSRVEQAQPNPPVIEELTPPKVDIPEVSVTSTSVSEVPTTPSVVDNPTPLQTDSASLQQVNSSAYVTPIVRKLAKDNDIDLSVIKGSGIGGRIRRQDVQEAIEAKKKAAEEALTASSKSTSASTVVTNEQAEQLRGKTVKMSRLRQVISRRMIESIQTSAQLTSVVEVDCSNIWALRQKHKNEFLATEGIKLTFLPFFVKIAAAALRNHPKLNATITGDEIVYHDHEHIGIAVDTPRGLLVPVIRNANDLSTTGVAKSIADIASRARSNELTPNELSGSTFTITNTGSGGTIIDTPIINQPEVAILAIPKIVRRPVVLKDEYGNETIGIRPMVNLCLSYDHRLVDGADAARYLNEVKVAIEEGNITL
ncbi:2-oxoglutarate dehydrogenase, E2 component, dihydrolipoamide succinyltransferase [Actinomyces sp. zg-332]|uniref:2-oxoglutarate dehydrogenase, E2 component, dihydrolipoamide succinyltransferase n=1 Tax=Actinomyces sp. zg-332 TaxID=2708340 RepID=UPI00142485A0|nr:2-oxoglutarate dehydrogenase, E2 component, dihydrolipoamide succinyltransferase [Actinomyces sp. zg-332]QPK93780.1 2-oxoglutarate dehydrogenase, E2 component, dihydrolipoamide succinyltransferase [Actinomyces sp. zg-332]